MKIDIYQQVTDRVVDALEAGTNPWVKPWRGGAGVDRNLISKRAYRGINTILLSLQGFESNIWGTYNQFAQKGFQVAKGQKATHIVFFKSIKGSGEVNQETGKVDNGFAVLRGYSVFNADQTDMPKPEPVNGPAFDPMPACEATIQKTGATITHGGGRACYIPSTDAIRLPDPASFTAPVHYYNTAFHELGHWTGAKNRLNRVFGSFGDITYAKEELVAEMTAAFLCGLHGIQGEMQHADYIGEWIKTLQNDRKAVFRAASMAQKATDLIMGTTPEANDD